MKVLPLDEAKDFQKLFIDTFGLEKINANGLTRHDMLDFFRTEKFQELYFKAASVIAKKQFSADCKVLLQSQPTPRIYKPDGHATSFHTDYLYGHGAQTYTVWIPLFGIETQNTFMFIKPECEAKYTEEKISLNYSGELEKEIIEDAFYVDAKGSVCVMFNSREIHGSPQNKTNTTRYSFDFRLAVDGDATSNKSLLNFFDFKDGAWVDRKKIIQSRRYLKYICGGKNITTLAQHIVCEGVAKQYNMTIVTEEAELERYGHPILKNILNQDFATSDFDAVMVASEDILDAATIAFAQNSKVKVFAAEQEKFIN